MAYSAGFTPHPKISYAGAAPTGAASEAEYVELGLALHCDPDALRQALDAALPHGLDVLEVVPAAPGALADRLQASIWRIVLPGVSPAQAEVALTAFLDRDEVLVERLTKSGKRELNVRAAVIRGEVRSGGSGQAAPRVDESLPGARREDSVRDPQIDPADCAILHLVVRHLTPSARPDDILTAIRSVTQFAPTAPAQVTRLAQGPLNGETGSVEDPLQADTDVADVQRRREPTGDAQPPT